MNKEIPWLFQRKHKNTLASTMLEEMTMITNDRIPTLRECEQLIVQYAMLPNIVKHSRKVMDVALAIADNLHHRCFVNRELVQASALLHDITKTKSLVTHEHHDISGGVLLRKLGFRSAAEIVEQHVIIEQINLDGRLEEREIVYYADKRVLHDRVVSLEERVEDLILRYGTTEKIQEQIRQNKSQALAIERKIAACMVVDLHQAIQGQCEDS